MKTSQEVFEEYQQLLKKEKIERSFLKIENRYFIKILKEVRINLKDKEEKISILTDLPFREYYEGYSIEVFLEKFRNWALLPLFKFSFSFNRKEDNKYSSYYLPKLRKSKISFEDLDITIGSEAKKDVNFDKFISDIKEIINLQRNPTEEEIRDFERYYILLERQKDLKRQLGKEESYHYSSKKKDSYFVISKEEYNEKLKLLEDEFKLLNSKYDFLEVPNLYYEEIQEVLTFDKWKSENLFELEENWAELDDEDKEEYNGDFEEFALTNYNFYLEEGD